MQLCSSLFGREFRHPSLLLLLTLGAVVVFTANALGQGGSVDSTGTGGRHSIQGRLIFPSGTRAEVRMKIRLESSGFGDLSVFSDINGSFSFRSLAPGNYTVVVDGGEDYQTVRESVYIEPATTPSRRSVTSVPVSRPFNVQVYLTPKAQLSNKPGVIDAALAAVPKPAVELYYKALESAGKGDNKAAVEHLKQAVGHYPSFSVAINELGVQYMILKELEKASEAFRSAVSLTPDNLQPRLNYGIALLNQMKFDQAEMHLRQAIKISDSAPTAHMYLGITLISLKRYDEAEKELGKSIALAGGKLAQSHYYLGGIYWKAGDFKRAAEELEKYLQLDPKAANAEKVRLTIKDLRSKT